MKKILLLVLTLTLIAVPSTMSYFTGQHTYDAKTCIDCHPDEENDVTMGTAMTTFSCINCHPFGPTSGLIENGHSATDNMCNECHIYTENQFISQGDSHQNLYQAAIDDDSRVYANEACFFCHSDATKSIDFYRPEFIEYEIVDIGGDWFIQNFIEGTEINYQISLNRNNGLHSTLSGADVGCTECHTDITTAINTSGHFPSNKAPHQNTSSCAQCHDNWNQGTRDQHVSKSITCVSCHSSHTLGVNILDSISNYPAEYEGNICLGCHKNMAAYVPQLNNVTNFKVFLEPSSVVIIT